ncbi:Nuclear nucleic acid-binding protein C1D [Morella rubra]|uniref:Nuclear nucleic acid-binding protein C1D n=1 Tax=Morella rubra TaxID=262757 RepID=A0A6A1UWA5_9ROSI|nr:Nuclear nucleic acid-binding protein C1D [Morella rubra]
MAQKLYRAKVVILRDNFIVLIETLIFGSVAMEKGGVGDSSVVPDSVMDSVDGTLTNVQEVESHLLRFLSLSDPEVLSQMPPLQRAQALLVLARTTTILFALRLRCTGVHPDDHPVKSELERLSLYQDKLERFTDLSKAPLRPSTTLNYQAATRFIEHSLPDLTHDQRQNMRNISRGEGPKIKYLERSVQKKRKYQSSDKQSVQTAAKEFLEKAARELLGDNNCGFKGPLLAEASDEDNAPAT